MSNSDRWKKRVKELEAELERKNAILESYGDHRNWVKPSQVRERLGIPATDPSGQPIEEPVQCFVGARYPWEPALKAMIGVPEESEE